MQLYQRLKGSGLKTRLLNPRDELCDRWLGIRTSGWRPHVGNEHDPDWRVEYVPTAYAVLGRLFRRVGLGPDDVFLDLGAGLGRAVFAAAWAGAGRALGVEIDPLLVRGARDNLARSRLAHRRIEFLEQGADGYPQEESTVIFMFNPFGAGTMRAVGRRIQEGLAAHPRRLRIVYLNPFFASELDALPCLERLDHWDEGGSPRTFRSRWRRAGGWSAAFWRSKSH
jgi:SAM-dependent methyltransferase